nr:VanW family protein [Streptomyces coryli]
MRRISSPGAAPDGRRRIPRAALAAGAVGLGFAALYGAGLRAADDDIPEGTHVRGVDIGGMDRATARAELAEQTGRIWPAKVPVRIGDHHGSIDTRAAGLTLDSAGTAHEASRSGKDPITVIGRLLGIRTAAAATAPVIRMDEPKARAALRELARDHAHPVRHGAIRFQQGAAVPVRPRTGQALDMHAALAALRRAAPADAPVRLPLRESKPRADATAVGRAMEELAEPAMSEPVTLTTDRGKVKITPEVLGAHLTLEPDEDGDLTPQLDAAGLLNDPSVHRPLQQITDPSVNAKLRVEGGRVVVASDGKAGQEVTATTLREAVLPLLTKEGEDRTGPVATERVEPTLTRDNVSRLGITEQMSTFTVNFPAAPYRTKNVGRAAELINGSVVLPGDTWSFNRTVGERTKANGFVEGVMIYDGKYALATGGGVSAVATTVYNAIFFAGVDPTEHGAHSFYIERYPEGREATVAWGRLDLKFKNDSGNAIYIKAAATQNSITISFLGTKKYDEIDSVKGPRTKIKEPGTRKGDPDPKKCEPQTPLEGFDVKVDRIFRNGGEEVRRETFKTHYTPRDAVTCE